MEPLEENLLGNIKHFADNITGLFEGIHVEYRLLEHSEIKKYFSGAINVKAPYYLVIYSEKAPGYQLNAGYLMQQISLYLTTKAIGSCYLGMLKPKSRKFESGKQDNSQLEYVITLAFGKAANDVYRSVDKFKRLPLEDIAVFKSDVSKNIKAMVSAARLAPSSMNSQPWRFVVYDNRIHVFCRKNVFLNSVLNEIKLIDIGICLAHLLITAEELWIDVKTIFMENIRNQSFKKNDYVISIKVL